MRVRMLLFAFPLLTLPASAALAASSEQGQPPEHHHMTWEKRFHQANTTHDGHLTLEQAKGGYRSVAAHFDEIDADKKGYVTEDDIRAWHKLRHAMHTRNRNSAGAPPQPTPALHRVSSGPAEDSGTPAEQPKSE